MLISFKLWIPCIKLQKNFVAYIFNSSLQYVQAKMHSPSLMKKQIAVKSQTIIKSSNWMLNSLFKRKTFQVGHQFHGKSMWRGVHPRRSAISYHCVSVRFADFLSWKWQILLSSYYHTPRDQVWCNVPFL